MDDTGASSGVLDGAFNENVNVADRRSNPYLMTSPCVATGAGRRNASAARRPAMPSSGGVRLGVR